MQAEYAPIQSQRRNAPLFIHHEIRREALTGFGNEIPSGK